MNELDLAYLAGVFDGEGCISFSLRERASAKAQSPNLQTIVAVQMSDRSTVELFHVRWPGVFGKVSRARFPAHWKTQWRWVLMADDIVPFLDEIRPYLRLKRPQAELALRYYAEAEPRVRFRKVSEAESVRRRSVAEQMVALNSGGR